MCFSVTASFSAGTVLLGIGTLMLASYWLLGRLFPTQTIGPAQSPPPAMEGEQPLPPSAFTAEAFAFHRDRQYSNAIAVFEACIKQYPEFSDAHHGLAQSLREAGDPARALASHDRAIALDPDRFDLYWERGATHLTGMLAYYDPADTPRDIEHHFPLFGVRSSYAVPGGGEWYGGWSQAYRPMILKDV